MLHFRFLLKIFLVFGVCSGVLLPAVQLLAAPKPIPVITEITQQLNDIEEALKVNSLSPKQLQQLRKRLVSARAEADKELKRLTPMLQDAQARFEALKPGDENESKEKQPSRKGGKNNEQIKTLTIQRDKISLELASLHSSIKLVNSLLVRADQLNNRISEAKEKHLATQLLEHSRSLFSPQLWLEGLQGIKPMWQTTRHVFAAWWHTLSQKEAFEIWQVIGVTLIFCGLILWPFRLILFSFLTRFSKSETPTALQKSLYAVMLLFCYTAIPVALVWGTVVICDSSGMFPDRIAKLSNSLVQIVFFTSFGYALFKAILSPKRTAFRLVNLSSSVAVKLFALTLFSVIVYAATQLGYALGEIVFTPITTMLLFRGISSICTAILLGFGLRMLSIALGEQEDIPQKTSLGTPSFLLPRILSLLQPLVWPCCVLIIAAPLFGYISLGAFLTEQLGLLVVVLGLLGMFTALIDNGFSEGLKQDTRKTRSIARTMGFQSKTVLQLGVVVSGFLQILLYLAAFLVVFAPWGLQSTDFVSSLKSALLSIQVGSLTISPVRIVAAILGFILALLLVRGIQNWMVNRLFPTTSLDTGLKNSIYTSVGYLGFILATMLAFSYLGIDLSKLALVAGALSVGIGFGLQSIVNNFVSGLILLVERPVKTGDWVVVGSDQGYVQKISVRATTIETFDRATVIVPNADLISNRVVNWMYSGQLGRIIIPIGVSYDADPEQVRDILLKVAEESPLTVQSPPARVFFMDFGASSLDFELRCYVQDISSGVSAKSDLRFAIFRALKEAGIEIPFPQQDVHVRSLPVEEQQNGKAKVFEQQEDL